MERLLANEVDHYSKHLAHHENVKKFFISPDEFTIGNGLLTPTLKLKRRKIIEQYREDLKGLYRS